MRRLMYAIFSIAIGIAALNIGRTMGCADDARVTDADIALNQCSTGDAPCSPEQYDALCERGETWACGIEGDSSADHAYETACQGGDEWACEHIALVNDDVDREGLDNGA